MIGTKQRNSPGLVSEITEHNQIDIDHSQAKMPGEPAPTPLIPKPAVQVSYVRLA
jgi:hypothetical protein